MPGAPPVDVVITIPFLHPAHQVLL